MHNAIDSRWYFYIVKRRFIFNNVYFYSFILVVFISNEINLNISYKNSLKSNINNISLQIFERMGSF